MEQNRPAPHSEAIVLAPGDDNEVVVKGPTLPGLKYVRYVAISHDEGKVSAATIQDVTLKVRPQERSEIYGGQAVHSFYGQPAPQGQARNTLYLGFTLPAGEDLLLTWNSPVGGTIRYTLHRYLIFDENGPMPAPLGPAGIPLVAPQR